MNLRLVGAMVAGSVPMAFLGAYLLHLIGHTSAAEKRVQTALGAALLLGAAAMLLRFLLDHRGEQDRSGVVHQVQLRPARTVAIGMLGGLIVVRGERRGGFLEDGLGGVRAVRRQPSPKGTIFLAFTSYPLI